ncbi:MAG: baseplate J/gp47 family protein [Pseudomonadota bacterium]
MAAADLLQAMVAALGTAQPERADPRLLPAHAPLDDRDAAALLAALRAIAPRVLRYEGSPDAATSDWRAFFPGGDAAALAALMARTEGGLPPHLALLTAFLRLQQRSQSLLNGFTANHLAFQMQQVLGFTPRAPQPDRAHLVVELKKGAAPIALAPVDLFTAGKDATRVEQLYAPVRTTVIGRAVVERLCGIARDGARLRFAPVADSADGLGAPLPDAEPRWSPFGAGAWPEAPVGFAVASPLLRMAEGSREVRLTLRLANLPAGVDAAALGASFDAHATGPKGWLGPFAVSGAASGDALTLTFTVPPDAPAVVDHQVAVHLQAFPAELPVVQLLLRAGAAVSYAALAPLKVRGARLRVAVSGMRALALENDESTLDAKKAFLPFGAQPTRGARFFVGCPEALSKPLRALTLNLTWQGAPADLTQWYSGYSRASQFTNGVSARVVWRDAAGTDSSPRLLDLMHRADGRTQLGIDTPGVAALYPVSTRLRALQVGGSGVARALASRQLRSFPIRAAAAAAPSAPRAGFITIDLVDDFLHADYRRESVAGLLATPRKVLNEPYTPKVQQLTLDYAAESDDSRLDDPEPAAFTDTDVQFFQLDAFGPARAHAWLAQARPWAEQGGITLLPAHPAAGELLIGLSGIAAGDSVSLLLQVAEGSADPRAAAQSLEWSVLADNAWRALAPGELALDATRGLRASGLVEVVLPRETRVDNTRLPAGLVWLRASTPAAPRAACDLMGVHANAVEVGFVDRGNDPARLAAPLAAQSIAKMKAPHASVKTITQPYASFGGALAETDAALARRASERLRHRERAITGWDIERLVLQAFPSVYRAKCIPHASADSWLAAGHTMLVVVPDQRNRNAVDPLQPRVDLDTLERIREFVRARGPMQARLTVRNPTYRTVTLAFKVRLRPGHGFNFYRGALNEALVRAMSPWAFGDGEVAAASPGFGGRAIRSVLLDLVEALPYVDFVTDFRMTLEGDATDRSEIAADAPDAILVSAAQHQITELPDA